MKINSEGIPIRDVVLLAKTLTIKSTPKASITCMRCLSIGHYRLKIFTLDQTTAIYREKQVWMTKLRA
jgi:hypothetical protein